MEKTPPTAALFEERSDYPNFVSLGPLSSALSESEVISIVRALLLSHTRLLPDGKFNYLIINCIKI
jgi:hypothetical protein